MGTLLLAAGGGGDALGALLLRHRLLGEEDTPPLIATYAWERLRIDPVPGPRGRDGFQGLGLLGGQRMEILSTTATLPAGRSSLPRLSATSDARLFLLDPDEGTCGLVTQLDHLADVLDIDRLVLVDVGGDIVARGDEPGLRSPLADALSLSAGASLGLPGQVAVTGPGADGELTETEVITRIGQLAGRHAQTLDALDSAAVLGLLDWHPSEATALTAAAAIGIRGTVEIGRRGSPVTLTDLTPALWTIGLHRLASQSLLARALSETRSLDEAHEIAGYLAISELTHERDKARERRHQDGPPTRRAPHVVAEMAKTLQARGVDYATTRSLAEELISQGHGEAALEAVLAHVNHARHGPLWDLRILASHPLPQSDL